MCKNKKSNLQNFILTGMILIYILVLLVESNIFNFSRSTEFGIVSVLSILFIVMLVAMNFSDSVGALLLSNFLLFFTLLSSSTIIKPIFFQPNSKHLKIYLSFFTFILIIFFINITIITLKLRNLKEPTLYNVTKDSKKDNILFTAMNKLFYLLDLLLYKTRILFPILAYTIAISIIILTFAIFYESNNSYSKENNLDEGLFYSQVSENNSRIRVGNLEPLYFSTCIFLNTSDSDIQPVGDTIKLLIQFEMLLAHIMNIIFIPTLLFFFLKFFEEKPSLCKIQSKQCIYNSTIEKKEFDLIGRRNRRKKNKRNRKNRYC